MLVMQTTEENSANEVNAMQVALQLSPEENLHLAVCLKARRNWGEAGLEAAEDLLEKIPINLETFDEQIFLREVEKIVAENEIMFD